MEGGEKFVVNRVCLSCLAVILISFMGDGNFTHTISP